MAPPHLLFQRLGDDLGVELRPLFADYDLEREMQQDVAQLIAHGIGIVGLDRLVQLEGFLDEVGTKRLRGLCAIPGTALPQFAHEYQSASKR